MLDQAVLTDNAGAIVLNLAQQDAVALRVTARFGFAVAAPVTLSGDGGFPFAVLQSGVTPGSASAKKTTSKTA